jgi:hypothetical protein
MSREVSFDIVTGDSSWIQTGVLFHRDQHVISLSLDSGSFSSARTYSVTLKTFDLDSDPLFYASFTGDDTAAHTLSMNLNLDDIGDLLGSSDSADFMMDVRDETRDNTLALDSVTIYAPVNREDDVPPGTVPDASSYDDYSLQTVVDGSWEVQGRETWLGSVLSALKSLVGGSPGDVILKTDDGFEYGTNETAETDPVFTASPAGGISSDDVSSWDTAYGWGDHSTEGYLTSVAFTDLESAAVQLSTEAFSDVDTSLMSAAAIDDLIESKGYITEETDNQTLTWDGETGELSISDGNTVDLDGRYDPVGSADSAVGTHESSYDHTLIATALQTIAGEDHSSLDNLEWSAAGHTVDTDVDLNSNSIVEVATIQFDEGYTETGSEPIGSLFWNSINGTVSLKTSTDTLLDFGQETRYHAKARGAISNGDVVQFAGWQGDHYTVKVAVPAEIIAHPQLLMGLATEDIANGSFGNITRFGEVTMNTTGWSVDDLLYWDNVTGQLTNVMPNAPDRMILMAAVIKEESSPAAANGKLLVRMTWGAKFTELEDVNGTPLTTSGQMAIWDNDNGYFDFTENINDYALSADLGTMSTQDANSVAITGGSISGIDDPTDEHGVGDRGYNDARYLTAETDTLDSVADRGATTDQVITTGGLDLADNGMLRMGTDNDASIYYDGTNLVVNPKEVGSGILDVSTNIESPAFVTDGGTSSQFVKGDGSLDSSTYLTAETDTWASVMARGNQSDTAGIIDVTNTEALLVRKDADAEDVFVVDTANSRVGIRTTPTVTLRVLGAPNENYIYTNAETPDEVEDAYWADGLSGGSVYMIGGYGGWATATEDYAYANGGIGGSFRLSGVTGGSGQAPMGVGTGGNGGLFRLSAGSGGYGDGYYESYGGEGGTFSMIAGAGGAGRPYADFAYVYGGEGGGFYLTAKDGGNASSTSPDLTVYTNLSLGGGNGGAINLSGGNGGNSSSGIGDTLNSGYSGDGGKISITAGNGGNAFKGGTFTAGNGGSLVFAAGAGGTASTSSDGTGGNGGIIRFATVKGGAGSTANGTDGITEFVDGYSNTVLKILGDNTKNIQLPNDNGAILFGAGQDASTYYDGTNLVVNPKEVGSGYLQVDGQILATDKILFTQTDGNEYIDSLNDGYIDIGATTGIRLLQNTYLTSDNQHLYLGAGNDLDLYHDGTDSFIVTDATQPTDLIIDCGTEKTLELAEVVWDDLRTPVSQVRLAGSKPPTSTLYKGGEVLAFPSNADKTIYFNVQLPHKYKLGEDIEFHIHYVLPTAGSGLGAENVKWDFTYAWADIGDAIPAETPVPATLDMQNKSADTHYLGEIAGTIDGSGISGVSSMLICSLTRDTTVANNYTDDVYLMEVDFHFPINTLGSRQEAVK